MPGALGAASSMYDWRKKKLLNEPNDPLDIDYLDTLLPYFKKCKEKWHDIGQELGVESDSLQTILKTHQTEEECLVAMLKEGLTGTRPARMADVRKLTIPSLQLHTMHAISICSTVLTRY